MSNTNQNPHIVIATDGGCSPNPGAGAYAVIVQFYNHGELQAETEISDHFAHTTNNRMELQAAVVGLERLGRACDVKVISDSEYLVVNARDRLAGWVGTNKLSRKKNTDLWQRLWVQIERHQSVQFKHVKGHDGHELNERAHNLVISTRAKLTAMSTQNKPQRVLIAGSRQATEKQLEYAKRLVVRCQEMGYQIVVGDNPKGVDAMVVTTCREVNYTNVIVVGIASKPRNGGVPDARYEQQGRSYTERDQLMAKASNRGMFLVNKAVASPGTEAGYIYMKGLSNKRAYCIEFVD